ncbi:uncharacterized protein METZ01_LOCUS140064 [marine metagenome]|uniref:Uncharacterized protein n=1 Tax=marine metagenome TaxID=408172 RepID=A0A381ZD94_9ZZZZ
MDGFAIEGEWIRGLIHVDKALNEGVHVIGRNTVLGHKVAARYERQTNRNNAEALHRLRK